ncbi:uncharacterized protein [Henckelia pumila]|uniref:uncharacterized protein n=1 Tax=Henckelia pumila TaxID=405737 RepID=UPI003C6E25C1
MNFLSACRPIIGLDGCFLKTAFGGQLLAAIGRDGNDGMVPIAIAVVGTENYETWTWFLTELLEDIGGIGEDRWTFVSDRQKGLLEALKDLIPNCEHRFCARHMLQNFKKKFKNPDLVRLFWKAAGTGNKNVFDVVMKEIATLDPKLNPNHETAAEWLEKIPPKHWAKSHFLTQCKSECFVNNICESFNNLILVEREQPIITMLEGIRNKMMKMIQVMRKSMEEYTGNICPNILKRIKKAQDTSRSCFSIYYGEEEYQIQYVNGFGILEQFVVKLKDNTCTCGFFQLRGYPCCHAACAIAQGVVDYCKFSCAPLRPPPIKNKRGRPKKNRRKDPDEGKSVSTRKDLTHTCSRCLEVGHNKATCKNTMHPKSNLNKRPEGFGNSDEMVHQPTQASSSAFASRKRKKSNESRPTRNSTIGQADDTTRESVAQKHGSVAGDDI